MRAAAWGGFFVSETASALSIAAGSNAEAPNLGNDPVKAARMQAKAEIKEEKAAKAKAKEVAKAEKMEARFKRKEDKAARKEAAAQAKVDAQKAAQAAWAAGVAAEAAAKAERKAQRKARRDGGARDAVSETLSPQTTPGTNASAAVGSEAPTSTTAGTAAATPAAASTATELAETTSTGTTTGAARAGTPTKSPGQEAEPAPSKSNSSLSSEAAYLYPKEKRTALALKTNLLYDAATAVNYGIEIPIGGRLSVQFQHTVPWWLSSDNQYCAQLQSFGGEMRIWFGGGRRRARAAIEANGLTASKRMAGPQAAPKDLTAAPPKRGGGEENAGQEMGESPTEDARPDAGMDARKSPAQYGKELGKYTLAHPKDLKLKGHFIGINAFWGTCDFQFGRKLCYQAEFNGLALTYGYATPVGKKKNASLEFSIGAGFAQIPYQHYIPSDDWSTLFRDRDDAGTINWWGPTKAEISLVVPIRSKRRAAR